MIAGESLLNELADALDAYRQAITNASSNEDREDYLRLVAITEKVMMAIREDNITEAKMALLGFSRQVSDSFALQPAEFKRLASKISEVQRLVA